MGNAGDVRFATLNLWGWFDSWPRRRAVLLEHWPALAADVLFLQESCFMPGHDQAFELAEELGFPYFLRSSQPAAAGEAVAVLSRWPLKDPEEIALPAGDTPRLALRARIPELEIDVVSAHADFRPLSICAAQVEALCALPGARLVVAGDLNAAPALVRPLAEAGGFADSLSWREVETWPCCEEQFARGWQERSGYPPPFSLEPRRLDYVLARGLELASSGAMLLGDAAGYASDHAVVYADYRALASVEARGGAEGVVPLTGLR